MKKVGIVTIYNNENCGSYLQAVALYNFIESNGYDVYFVKNKLYKVDGFPHKILKVIKSLFRLKIKNALYLIKSYYTFWILRKKYKVTNSQNTSLRIYGSDTIWNINGKSFGPEWKHYWGYDFAGKKIAYSPSIGPAHIDDILAKQSLCQCLKSFDYISVRDDATEELVQKALNIENVKRTVDPTMLMPISFYERFINKTINERYILFYCFEKIDQDIMEIIKSYADKNGLKIYGFGYALSKCDKRLSFYPVDMMTYYSSAQLIVTNTFHGNVFSILFNKNFINIEAGKNKITDLLKTFNLSARTIKNTSELGSIIDEYINYTDVNSKLEELRSDSGNYLINAVENCMKDIEDDKKIQI